MPVPSGVTDLRIAGESHLSGIFFLRARVKDTNAFLYVLRSRQDFGLQASDKESDYYAAQPEKVRAIPYALSVGWEEVERLKNAEYYHFSTGNWSCTLVIDRKNKIIYINGDLL